MSIYGNIIREHDEIMYMYTMFQHESSIDSLLESNISDSILVEMTNVEQLKETIRNLFKALIDRATKIIKWIGEKFYNFISNIKKKFKEIRNINKTPIKNQAKEAETSEKTENEQSKYDAFFAERTKIGFIDIEKIIYQTEKYLKHYGVYDPHIDTHDDEGEEKRDYLSFIKSHIYNFDSFIVNDGEGLTRDELTMENDLEKDIEKLSSYLLDTKTLKRRVEEKLKFYKKALQESCDRKIDGFNDYWSKEYYRCKNEIEDYNQDLSMYVQVCNELGEYLTALTSEYGHIQKFLNLA